MSSSFGLYVHIPFCAHKCPYCDFNSYSTDHRSAEFAEVEARYTDALITELRTAARSGEWRDRVCKTVFFGGGTPSLFQAASIGRVLQALRDEFPLSEQSEWTLEANPGTVQESVDLLKLVALREFGINRISIGAQSFSPERLRFLGRIHGPEEIHRAASLVREAGLTEFNLDLIFGTRPGSGDSFDEWVSDLENALKIGPEHISVYGLTIEPGTEFGKRARRGEVLDADDELQAAQYSKTQLMLTAAGYEQYELSNYARPGHECRHNLNYWRRGEYLGLGAGAHTFHATSGAGYGRRWSNIPGPKHYMERIEASGRAVQREEELTKEQAELEFISLSLRLRDGLDLERVEALYGKGSQLLKQASPFLRSGMLEETNRGIRLSQSGFLLADTIISELCNP